MTEILIPSDQKTIDLAIKLRQESGNMYSDLTAERLYRQWLHGAFTLTPYVKDEIGVLWMSDILQVGMAVRNFDYRNIEASSQQRRFADYEIGMMHSSLPIEAADYKNFWKSVSELVPGFLEEEDLDYLVEKDINGVGAFTMILVFDQYNPNSTLLHDLVTNAIAYK